MGRQTLPIVLPQHARKTVIVGLMAWSIALVAIWELDVVAAALLLGLAAITGVRFLIYRTVPADQVSFYVYNVSNAVANSESWLTFLLRSGSHTPTRCLLIGDCSRDYKIMCHALL